MPKVICKTESTLHYYYAIKFDGTNEKELLEFINEHGFNANNATEFIRRPENIPNLDYMEYNKWWEDTGFKCIVRKRRSGKYLDKGYKKNTHGINNKPDWEKDEILQFYINNKSRKYEPDNYYCHLIGIHVGDIFVFDAFYGNLDIHEARYFHLLPKDDQNFINELLSEETTK